MKPPAPICSTATDVHDVVPSRDVPMANATKCDMERLVRTARPTIWSENVTWAAMLDVKNWSEPKRLSEKCRWSDDLVPLKSSGVYRLIALKNPNDFFPSPLQRVCGIDKSGTLYEINSALACNTNALQAYFGKPILEARRPHAQTPPDLECLHRPEPSSSRDELGPSLRARATNWPGPLRITRRDRVFS
jgi:hypothetical protein